MAHFTRPPSWMALGLCVLLAGCSSDPATFLTYSHQKTGTAGKPDAEAAPRRTDALALNYANEVECIFRSRATGARYTREGSDTGLAGIAAFTGAAETLSISASSVAGLGLAGGGILQLRNIFDAKGRSNAYFEAAERIHSAIKDYGAHNLNDVSETHLTPNGWTLVNIVQSNIDIVNKILNGHLPTPEDLAQSTEPMTPGGAFPQSPGSVPANNIPTGALKAAVAAIPRRTQTTTTQTVQVETDNTYLASVNALLGRINNLSDEAAIGIAKNSLRLSASSGEAARGMIFDAIAPLKSHKDEAAVEQWNNTLPVQSDYQQLVASLFARADKMSGLQASSILKTRLSVDETDGARAKDKIKTALIKLRRVKMPAEAALWEEAFLAAGV